VSFINGVARAGRTFFTFSGMDCSLGSKKACQIHSPYLLILLADSQLHSEH